MFWLYRLYKEPSPKSRERFPDIQHSTDRTSLVWKDDEVFKSKELLPVQPVRENVSVDIPDEIKALLKAYWITDDDKDSEKMLLCDGTSRRYKFEKIMDFPS